MQQINSAMVQTVKGMSNAMKNMQVEQIANTMQSFEKQFEDMDVRSGLLLLLLLSCLPLCSPRRLSDEALLLICMSLCLCLCLLLWLSGYMEGTMESTTGISTPPEEVDTLIQVGASDVHCTALHSFVHVLSTSTNESDGVSSDGGRRGGLEAVIRAGDRVFWTSEEEHPGSFRRGR